MFTNIVTGVCVVRAFPEPVTSWVKNGEELDPASSKRIRQTDTGNLVIRDVEKSDAGEYFCQVENMIMIMIMIIIDIIIIVIITIIITIIIIIIIIIMNTSSRRKTWSGPAAPTLLDCPCT